MKPVFVFLFLVTPILPQLMEISPKVNDPPLSPRIVKGHVCNTTDHPYMVSLRSSIDMLHFCGATIISKNGLLTAAHCVVGHLKGPETIIAVAGLSEDSKTLQMRQVKKIEIPPSYIEERSVCDVAILLLEHSFDYNDVIQPVQLHDWDHTDVKTYCSKGLIIGWGRTTMMSYRNLVRDELHCVEVPVLSHSDCQRYINLLMERSKFCALGKGQDACLGDSGGPMICNDEQIGVISSGFGCGVKKHPGLYARVDYHYRYITRVLNGASRTYDHNYHFTIAHLVYVCLVGFAYGFSV